MSDIVKATCKELDSVYTYALDALAGAERTSFEEHLAACAQCRAELETVRPTIGALEDWPVDVTRAPSSLWKRIADQVGGETVASSWRDPDWREVGPGIFCKTLSQDPRTKRLSMMVRLAPGVSYPPHSHAGLEELFLLDGELWIDDRKLYPGDYNRAESGTADARVYSETGCTCVLVTSGDDVLA